MKKYLVTYEEANKTFVRPFDSAEDTVKALIHDMVTDYMQFERDKYDEDDYDEEYDRKEADLIEQYAPDFWKTGDIDMRIAGRASVVSFDDDSETHLYEDETLTTTTYNAGDFWMVDIVTKGSYQEAWIYNRKCGIKTLMFAVQGDPDFIDVVASNLKEYEKAYREEYLFDDDIKAYRVYFTTNFGQEMYIERESKEAAIEEVERFAFGKITRVEEVREG